MSTLPTLIAKAKAEKRPIIDLLRAWNEAGCPEFDPTQPFWTGMAEAELESFEDWHELKAASAQIGVEVGTYGRRIAQAVPGHPFPDDTDPEEPDLP